MLDIGDKKENLVYVNSRRYFNDDESKNYLVFLPLFKNFGMIASDTETIIAWKFERFSYENTKLLITPGNNHAPRLKLIHNSKVAVECKKSCLTEDKKIFTHVNVVNLLLFTN